MEEADQPPDLSAIMDSIKALTWIVAFLQLASGLQQMGGQRHPERPMRTRVQVFGNTEEV